MASSSRRLALAVGFLLTGNVVAKYVPFADVEEFRPQQLHKFCDPEVKTGMRHCEGTTHRTLEDGGVAKLNWAMHADPDRILSLDVAKDHGVEVVKCTPSSLELVLPESHAQHARKGELIVGSHFVHGCEHLMQIKDEDKLGDEPVNNNLYHRVVKVHSLEKKDNKVYAKLWTKELPSLGHAIGSLTYDFQFTPPEAVDESSFPKRRTWDGEEFHNGKWLKKPTARRLFNDNGDTYEEGPYDNDRDRSTGRDANGNTIYNPADTNQRYNANDFQRPTDKYRGGGIGASDKYRFDGGHPTLGGSTVTNDDVKSLLNFQPKKVANFGWNWDFQVNASQDISFNYTVPGSKMFLVVKKPHIKAHSELKIKFRSYMPNENAEDTFFTDNTWVSLKKSVSTQRASIFDAWEPRVKWEASLPGHGQIELGILLQANAQTSVSSNPLELIQIPVLQDFWKPKWFGTLDFSLGSFPVSITPGVQFKAKFFHYGTFRGSLAVGLNTFPRYNPKLQFDSFTGLRVDFQAKLRETKVTPPNWLVSTSHFECGLALEPTIWIKGHMGQMKDSTKFAAALRPYFNMTITRAGDINAVTAGTGKIAGNDQKELVLYPFRVVGLNPAEAKKNSRYKIRISTRMPARQCTTRTNHYAGANSLSHYDQNNPMVNAPYSGNGNDLPNCEQYKRRIDTSESLSWGDIDFHDPVDRFSFGMIAQRMLFYLEIDVQLIEVDYSNGQPFELESPVKTVRCKTIMNGVCQPSPVIEELFFQEQNVRLYMHMVWKNNPRTWFSSRTRGVAASVPEVIINQDYIAHVDPDYTISATVNQGIVYGSNANKPLILVFEHSYKSYPMLLDGHNGYVPGVNSSSVKSNSVVEFGSSFLSTWDRTCVSGTHGCDPRVTLYIGEKKLASADIPRIPWNSAERKSDSMMNLFGSSAYDARVIPVSVALKAAFGNPGSAAATTSFQHVGLVRMKFAIANPAAWNRWIRPYQFTPVQLGSNYKLVWTLNNADPYVAMPFTITLMKGMPDAPVTAAAGGVPKYMRQRIGDTWFQQVSADPIQLKPITLAGMHRTRFEHVIAFGGMANGDQVMVNVQWKDKLGHLHSMNSPAFLIESKVAKTEAVAQSAATVTSAPLPAALQPIAASGGRRLSFIDALLGKGEHGWKQSENGEWNHRYQQKHNRYIDRRQCARKDLNFAFGAGIMFRAFVKHLSLPKDLPILGAIQSAPEMGMPWQSITGWASKPTDLKSKLPSLLCRHGVCSAALPGCSEYNTIQHYYPEVSIHFKKTLRYPRGADKLKAENQWIEVLRQALSFTFAVAPEFIQILVHYMDQIPQQPATTAGGGAHRRRFMKYHNVLTGVESCENRNYNLQQCSAAGCCQYDQPSAECNSAVGNGPCYKHNAPGFLTSATFGETTAAPAVAVAAVPAGTTVAPAVVAVPVTATAAGPVITPLQTNPELNRRLEEDKPDEDAETMDLDEKELDKAGLDDRRVHKISIRFKKGLKYKVDNELMDTMIKEGLFQQLEEVPTEDEPLRIHKIETEDLNPESHKNEPPEYDTTSISNVLGSSQRMLLISAVFGGVLLGVAFVVRRARASYQRVEEDTLLVGPVE
jgi:hypothetical protein